MKDMIRDKSLLPIRSTGRNRLLRLKAVGLLAVGLLSLPMTASSAIVATINFEGVDNNAPVGSFYSGVIFSSNALGLIDNYSSADVDLGLGGTGLFENEPSPSTIMHFQEGAGVTLSYAAGFTGGFSFYYTALDSLGSVSAFDGTGNLIGSSISLGAQTQSGPGCSDNNLLCVWNFVSVVFGANDVAKSIVFSGTPYNIGFDNITLGVSDPAPVPLPAAAWLLLSGLAGLGFVGRRRTAR